MLQIQLWIDRVCRVNFGFNTSVCDNLNSDPKYSDYQNQVQQAVAQYNIVGSYIENVPTIIMSLYLGMFAILWHIEMKLSCLKTWLN